LQINQEGDSHLLKQTFIHVALEKGRDPPPKSNKGEIHEQRVKKKEINLELFLFQKFGLFFLSMKTRNSRNKQTNNKQQQ